MPKPPRITRRKRLLIILVLAFGIYGVWWWWQPRNYHLVRKIAVTAYDPHYFTFTPTMAGFLLRENECHFTMYDWEGKERWRVVAEMPQFTGWPKNSSPAPGEYDGRRMWGTTAAASPNGHYLASLTFQGITARLRIWQDGKLTGTHELPIPLDDFGKQCAGGQELDAFYRLYTLDDGRVFCWPFLDHPAEVRMFAGDRVVAVGTFPAQSKMCWDGSALVSMPKNVRQFSYFTLKIAREKVVPAYRYTVNTSVATYASCGGISRSALFGKGMVLGSDGIVCTASGPTTKMYQGYQNLIGTFGWPSLVNITQNGSVGIHATVIQRGWALPGNNGYATPDGRFAVTCELARYPKLLDPVFTIVKQSLPGINTSRVREIRLYEKPGTIRAKLRLSRVKIPLAWQQWHDIDDQPIRWQDYSIAYFYPSPDGHTLLVVATDIKGDNHQVLVFKW